MLMLIPLGFVRSVVDERGYRYQGVLSEISNSWGNEQTLSGPVLTVPYTEQITTTQTVKDQNGKSTKEKKTSERHRKAHFLPADLQLHTKLIEEYRNRSIFSTVVFSAAIDVEASFDIPDLNTLSENITGIDWDKATVSFGVSDTRAINKVESFLWNGKPQTLSPGTQLTALPSGFHAKLNNTGVRQTTVPTAETGSTHQLAMRLNINGSGGLYFTSNGERTRLTMQSSWPHPSFQGDTLPVDRKISSEGFTATWDIPHLARNYDQHWLDTKDKPDLFELITGVSMFEPNSLYSRITRASKYGVLFISLTFLTLFIFELSIKQRIHLIQYGLIGVSLSLFYLILLSLSEHITFVRAYAAAALTCTAMISLYTAAFLKSAARGLFVAALLSGLYALLYSLIKMEDFALLMGTFVLLAVVIVLMVLTRNQRLA